MAESCTTMRSRVALRALERSSTSERNKTLIKEFLNDCAIGWGGKKLDRTRLHRIH